MLVVNTLVYLGVFVLSALVAYIVVRIILSAMNDIAKYEEKHGKKEGKEHE